MDSGYACLLELDPNTANKYLSLSEGNTKVTREKSKQPHPHHPDRFDGPNQVLCSEGLSGTRCYWEAEWCESEVHLGVTYKDICRKSASDESLLGHNENSWSLCFGEKCSVWHKVKIAEIPAPPSNSGRVGVYLDWPAGTLSFYSVSSGTVRHLHTFHTTFTKPLYPGFRVWSGSVKLCPGGTPASS
ncbi:stonustoxin subunit beta-like [Megalops cyprinoides]|uniref:stonustoxin subunit beta-like n=1 Tax=Megalops cyprinoides TaxID=118141 RepID=UPI0018653765|nr:stonustoxin subunit beta-like [Megalops cyprinoides]